jgi:hypothetical protein
VKFSCPLHDCECTEDSGEEGEIEDEPRAESAAGSLALGDPREKHEGCTLEGGLGGPPFGRIGEVVEGPEASEEGGRRRGISE